MRMIPLVFLLIVVLFSLGSASAYSYNDTIVNDNVLVLTSDKATYGRTADGNYVVFVELENTSPITTYSDIDFELYIEKPFATSFSIVDIKENVWTYGAVARQAKVDCKVILPYAQDLNGEQNYYCQENSVPCRDSDTCYWYEDSTVNEWHWELTDYVPTLQLFAVSDPALTKEFEELKSYRNFSVQANSTKKFRLIISPVADFDISNLPIEFVVVAKSSGTPLVKSVLDPELGSYHLYDDCEDNWENWVTEPASDGITGIQESVIVIEGSSSCHLSIDVSSSIHHEAGWLQSATSIDISDVTGVSSGDPTTGTMTASVYVLGEAQISDLQFWIGSSDSDLIRFGDLNLSDANYTEGAWVEVIMNLTSATVVGIPDWTNMDYVRIQTIHPAVATDYNVFIDDIYFGARFLNVDVNVNYPEDNNVFDKRIFSSIDINFGVQSPDHNTLSVDINYSSSQAEGTGTVIISDMNTTGEDITCEDSNFIDTTICLYNWDISGVSDGNYYILAKVTNDVGNSDFDAGSRDFNIWTSDLFAIDANATYPIPLTIFDPDEAVSSIDLQFTDTSTCPGCNINDWNWYVDGTPESDTASPEITFAAYGDYNVVLIVSSTDGGEIRDQIDFNIHYMQYPQGLDINFSDNLPLINTAVDINSWFDQPPTITNVAWIVPDPDTNYTDFNTTHTFNAAGTKSVCFIATNDFDLNKLYCENITVSGIYSVTFREEDSANNFPTLSVAGDGLSVTIDGNEFSGDVSVDGVLNLSKQTLPTGRYTMLASATGMTERTFELDLNSNQDFDVNILLLSDTNASASAFTFFKPNDSDKFADANVTLHYYKLPNYWSGRITLDGVGGGSFFMNGADTNYAFDIEDGDTNYLYVGTDVNVLPPKRADTGADINANFTIAVSGGIASSNHNDLNMATIVSIYSDTNAPYSFTIDSNSDFIETTILVNPTGGDINLTIQPYLNPVADVLGTTFNTVKKSDHTAIEGVTIIIYQAIGGTDEVVASGTTDIKGEFLAFLVVNQSYKLTVIDVNGSTALDKEPYIQTSTTAVFIYLGSLGMDIIDIPGSISVLFTPGFETFTISNQTFTQKFISDEDFNTLDVNYFKIIVETTVAGVDTNVFDVNLYKDINWLGTATELTHSMILGTDFDFVDNNRFTVRTFVFFNDETVSIKAKSYFFRTTSSWMDIARGQFRVEMGCPSDSSACPATIIFSILLAAVFTAMAIMGIGPLRNSRSAGIIFMALVAFFTYLNWIPLTLTAIMTLAVLFIYSQTRGEA